MTTYLYHCDGCGQTIERQFPMDGGIPQVLYQDGHDAPRHDGVVWPLTCYGTLRRVWTRDTLPRTNLGYRPHAGHTQDDRYRFTHLSDKPLPSLL